MNDATQAHNLRLTQGLNGPVAPLDPIYLELLAELLRDGWKCLVAAHGSLMTTESEPKVTMLLQAWLLTDGREYLDMLGITAVTRGSESTSADGESFERRPDLNLHFCDGGGAERFPLRLECKLLDHGSGKSIADYFGKGVRRFVDGTYAWGRGDAMMVAYVRDASCLPQTITDYLARSEAARALMPTPPCMNGRDAISVHQRANQLIGTRMWRMGPINLWHVWLGGLAPSHSVGRKADSRAVAVGDTGMPAGE